MKVRTIALSTLLLSSLGASAQVTVDVDAAQKGKAVSPMLYGIFYEDINHAADGGLYAELVRNRSFEDNNKAPEHWKAKGNASLQLISKGLLNKVQGKALEVTFNGDGDGFNNEGYWGIPAVQGRTYKLSFWAKGKLKGKLKAYLSCGCGTKVFASTEFEGKQFSNKWTKYEATLTSKTNHPKALLWFAATGKGKLAFDVVSLMPPTFNNRENGMRPELASMLYDLRPKFFRFPGGCFVEGQQSPDNAFRWERTIGPIEERPGHWNVNWGYRTTDGIGFHEYLQLAEDLGSKPLYVVNVGIWHGGFTPVDSIQPWIDETLNALEYANGPVTSKYGALRAKNGHPAPFNIEYLEIGNENNQPNPREQSDNYYKRFQLFRDAVLAKYPNMHIIGNVASWGTDDPTWDSDEKVELLDEHYYRTPNWFADNFRKYDTYNRQGPDIYVGEYAVTQGFGNVGNLNAALGEAVYMMGMENNSDIVKMASYAPIFANVNETRWRPDMIQFNATHALGTPSYYVQRMMANNVGTRIMAVTQNNPYKVNPDDIKVKPATCAVGVGTWGTNASFEEKALTLEEGATSQPVAKAEVKGTWKKEGNVVKQTSWEEGTVLLNNKLFTSDEYTYKVRARKDKGHEGFLIVFNYVDEDNYCWLNLGGWGNGQHAIEQVIDGSKAQIAMTPGRVEEGRWYDVELHVKGDSVYTSIDGKQIFAAKLKPSTFANFFSSATYDEASGEYIVKLVNTSTEATTARINLKNHKSSKGRVIRLTGEKGTSENTIEQLTNVVPTEEQVSPDADGVTLNIPANSLNIVRIK